jgi:hypothetical protein
MFKMGSHDLVEHLKHNLCPKEGSGIKLVVWLLTTKSQESTEFLVWRWNATYRWKDLDKGYNFASNFISIRGLHTKLWGHKVAKVPTSRISGQNVIWMWISWKGIEYTIKGKVQVMVSLVSPSLPMVRPSIESAPTMHWPTCCLVLYKVWMIKCLSFFLVPSRSSSMPLYPPKVLRTKERAPTLYSSTISL